MKLAVIGSRNFMDSVLLDQKLSALKKEIEVVISGGAMGADTLAETWANENGVPTSIFLPDYKRYAKGAYRVRNEQIARECDTLIAFWDGASKGTQYTIEFARKLNKKVIVYNF